MTYFSYWSGDKGTGICVDVFGISTGANGTRFGLIIVNPKSGTFEAFSGKNVVVLPKVGSVSVFGTLQNTEKNLV